MKTLSKYGFIFLLLSVCFYLPSQNNFTLNKPKSDKIRFQLINNIMIVPVELNGVELSFVLDTGVSQPILFNLVNMDSLQMKNVEKMYLRGLGSEGSIQGIKSKGNILKIGDAISLNTSVSIVFDAAINFTPRLGVPVHGIIGYDLFKDFVVEVNYGSRYIRFFDPNVFKKRKSFRWETLPLILHRKKPYVDIEAQLGSKKKPVRLLIDSGGSDAIWLFEDTSAGLIAPKNRFFDDYLGKGLSGSVYGKRSKLDQIIIGNHSLNGVNVAFPDSLSIGTARRYKERNGSLSGNLLKRFNLFFDYPNQQLWLKKNRFFNEPFNYNNSGLIVEQRGFRVVKEQYNSSTGLLTNSNNQSQNTANLVIKYRFVLKPAYTVVEIRESSNAKKAGIELGDVIVGINGKNTSALSLEAVNSHFYDKEGKQIKLKILRKDKPMTFQFRLDDVFKQKKSLQTEGSSN